LSKRTLSLVTAVAVIMVIVGLVIGLELYPVVLAPRTVLVEGTVLGYGYPPSSLMLSPTSPVLCKPNLQLCEIGYTSNVTNVSKLGNDSETRYSGNYSISVPNDHFYTVSLTLILTNGDSESFRVGSFVLSSSSQNFTYNIFYYNQTT
jgi:hypothetical protein